MTAPRHRVVRRRPLPLAPELQLFSQSEAALIMKTRKANIAIWIASGQLRTITPPMSTTKKIPLAEIRRFMAEAASAE